MSVVCSATKRECIAHLISKAQGPLQKRGRKIARARGCLLFIHAESFENCLFISLPKYALAVRFLDGEFVILLVLCILSNTSMLNV